MTTTLTSLLDHLYDGDIVDAADLARVSNTNPRRRGPMKVPRSHTAVGGHQDLPRGGHEEVPASGHERPG